MSGYTPKGDKKAHAAYKEAFDALTTLSEAGQSMREQQETIEKMVQEAAVRVEAAEKELIQLQRQLEDAKTKKRVAVASQTSLNSEKQDLEEKQQSALTAFNDARAARDEARTAYLSSIPTPQEPKGGYPEVVGPNPGPLSVHGLGDVHGWAPGLVNYLKSHDLANVTIDGRDTSQAPEGTFPDVKSVTTKGMRIEGQWMDGSTFTPIKNGASQYRGAFGRVTVHPKEKFDQSLFLQVGDLNDRGDFSELSFVLMRKLALATGGRALALLGNHEEMLLTGNFDTWLKNEQTSGEYQSSSEIGSIRIRADLLGIREESQKEVYLRNLFFSYCAHFAHLLLTQEYMLRSMLCEKDRKWLVEKTQPALDLAGIDDKRLKVLATTETWDTLEACYAWLEKIWTKGAGLTVPGAIVVISTGHVLALHASIKSLDDFFRTRDGAEFAKTPRVTTQGADLRLHLYAMPAPTPTTIDKANKAMLWSRDGGVWGAASRVSKDMRKALDDLHRHLPHVTTVMQGHEPLLNEGLGAKVVSVEGRKHQRHTLVNLDVGMTPVYLHRKVEDKYNFNRVPGGHETVTFGRDPPLLGADISVVGSGYSLDTAFIHPETEVTADIRKGDKASARIHHLPDGRMMIAALGKEHTLITGVHERRPVETSKGTLDINSTYTVATKQTTWTGRVRYTALYHVTRGASKKNHHDALEAYNKTVEAQDKEDRLREEQERKEEAARKKAEQQLKREQEAAARREEALRKSAQTNEKGENTASQEATTASPSAKGRVYSKKSAPPPAHGEASVAKKANGDPAPTEQKTGLADTPSVDGGATNVVDAPSSPEPKPTPTEANPTPRPLKPVRAHLLVHIENLGKYAEEGDVVAKGKMAVLIVDAFRREFKHQLDTVRCTIVGLPETVEGISQLMLNKTMRLDEYCDFVRRDTYTGTHDYINLQLRRSPNYVVIQGTWEDTGSHLMASRYKIGKAKWLSRDPIEKAALPRAMKSIKVWRDRP